jgi:oligosaccharide reducing-end xylanase
VLARAGSVAAPYEIGTWEGFRPAAISFTFDDDLPNQYAKAVPMFNACGFKLTLFTVTSWLSGWSNVQMAASYGHEVASHTVTHPTLSGLSLAQQTNELANSQAALNANVTNQSCLTLAYPNCVEASEAVTGSYYIAARGCSGQLVPSTPSDFLNISSFVCGPQGPIQTPAQFNAEANAAAAANSWCVYLIHAIDNDNGYSPLSSATLQASVNFFNTNRNKFWVETFGHVVRYIRERDASSVAESANTGGRITLQVTNSLNAAIYNFPITLRRPLPAAWLAAAVSQNGMPISAQLVSINSTHYVMFDIVPNGGDVVLSKSVLPFSMSHVSLGTPTNLTFELDGQAGASYAVCGSSDLVNWLPLQSNTLAGASTNISMDASSGMQFFRAVWLP